MSFVLAGSALSKLVLAHDTEHANPEDLMEPYSGRSEEELPIGLRWFYCAGLSIALMCMGSIAMTHTFKTIPNVRLRKPIRLAYRFAVAIVILLLPLAGDSLNSLELVATTTCLVVSVLFMELTGSACVGEGFWGFKEGRRKCTYSARCHVSRKELQARAKDGKVLDVEEIAKRDKSGEQAKEGFSL
jgi:hypothetical protein